MGMQINTNMAALNAYRNLSDTQNSMSKSLEKLSSGFRINRAADDAAGLAISEGLKSQIGGLNVASRNAQDGVSVLQTAEGGLSEAHTILQRLRDLAVQAGNDSNNTDSRSAISSEADKLVSELSRIAESTDFNGIKLLDGSEATLSFQVGASKDDSSQIQVDLEGADITQVVAGLGFGSTNVTTGTVSDANLNLSHAYQISQGSATVTVDSAAFLAATNGLEAATALNADSGFAQNFTAKADAIKDVNGNVTGYNLLIESKTPNAGNITVLSDTADDATFATDTTASNANATAGFDSAAAAKVAIGLIDTQITAVSTARADLGAQQNRFESAIRSLAVSKENLTAANSRIRDVDMASEMVNFTKSQILSQAGTAMLAQANQSNQGVLQLLR